MRSPPPGSPGSATERSECGLYVRIGRPRRVSTTLLASRWPLVAIDLDASGNPVGIEAIPAPRGDLKRWVASWTATISVKA